MYEGTFEEDNRYMLEQNERREKMLEFLKDYKAEKVTDGYEPFKGVFDCIVNSARIEDYDGDKPDYQGHKFFRYELQVADGQEKAGRRLWKSVDLTDESEAGQAKVKKLADTFFTIGLEFHDEQSLLACAEKFANMTLTVRAWHFKPSKPGTKEVDEGAEPIQLHTIKGVAKEPGSKKSNDVPF